MSHLNSFFFALLWICIFISAINAAAQVHKTRYKIIGEYYSSSKYINVMSIPYFANQICVGINSSPDN